MTRLEQLQQLVAKLPTDPMTHYALGIELIHLARWAEAIAAFRRAIEVDPNYSAAYYHGARALIGGGSADEARELLVHGMTIAKAAGDWHTHGEMQALRESIA